MPTSSTLSPELSMIPLHGSWLGGFLSLSEGHEISATIVGPRPALKPGDRGLSLAERRNTNAGGLPWYWASNERRPRTQADWMLLQILLGFAVVFGCTYSPDLMGVGFLGACLLLWWGARAIRLEIQSGNLLRQIYPNAMWMVRRSTGERECLGYFEEDRSWRPGRLIDSPASVYLTRDRSAEPAAAEGRARLRYALAMKLECGHIERLSSTLCSPEDGADRESFLKQLGEIRERGRAVADIFGVPFNDRTAPPTPPQRTKE